MFDPNFFRTSEERTGDSSRPFKHNHSKEHEERVKAHCKRVQRDYFDSGLARNGNKSSNVMKEDRLRVKAFYAASKLLYNLPVNERFITAICQTSDDMFSKADKAKIRQWELEYGQTRA